MHTFFGGWRHLIRNDEGDGGIFSKMIRGMEVFYQI
jgi:hypothetical protein